MDMERARQAVMRYSAATDLPVMAQPNAGQPKLVDMKVVYDETPEQMVQGRRSAARRRAPTSSAAAAAARPTTSARFDRRWIDTVVKAKLSCSTVRAAARARIASLRAPERERVGALGVPASTRASFAVHSTREEVDRLIDAFDRVKAVFA